MAGRTGYMDNLATRTVSQEEESVKDTIHLAQISYYFYIVFSEEVTNPFFRTTKG
jgi:hypothetical protein